MNCPYCLSDVLEEAVVCKFCARDLYLFKPMMAKIAGLEQRIEEIPNSEAYETRITELEKLLDEYAQQQYKPKTLRHWCFDITIYLLIPLSLLLLAHALITIVYDTKMIYLRIISMILPLIFGYLLFNKEPQKLFPWFLGVITLATSAVIGMSGITSLVDHTPIWPQNIFEWREVLEYAASISFSFLTGMLLGGIAFAKKQRHRRAVALNPLLKVVATSLSDGRISPSNMYALMKKLQEFGGSIVAIGTTGLSIYTGLKGIIGN